jgi:hypothetical protein
MPSRARGLFVVASAAIALAGVAVPAHAATATIRPGELDTADTRSAGHVEFLRQGVHVWTDDSSSNAKAAGYFSIPAQPIPSQMSLTWTGTQPQPGAQIVFDTNADRTDANSYNVLVGEPVYGADVWMTGGAARAVQRGIVCPSTTGGSGSDCHGTLVEWAAANPALEAYAGGFSLGSGIKGDGVIERMQYGTTVYEFTNLAEAQDGTDGQDGMDGATGPAGPTGSTGSTGPAGPAGATSTITVVNATGRFSFDKVNRGVRFTLTTADAKHGQVVGKKVRWVIKIDNEKVAELKQGLGDEDVVSVRAPKGSGDHVVTVKRNGTVVRTISVRA